MSATSSQLAERLRRDIEHRDWLAQMHRLACLLARDQPIRPRPIAPVVGGVK